jgi:hypothetical protein
MSCIREDENAISGNSCICFPRTPVHSSVIISISLHLDTELYGHQFGATLSTVFCSATIHSLPGYVSVLLVLEALQQSSKCYRDSAAVNS